MEITTKEYSVKGGLLICTVIAPDDEAVGKWSKYLEENLKVKAVK